MDPTIVPVGNHLRISGFNGFHKRGINPFSEFVVGLNLFKFGETIEFKPSFNRIIQFYKLIVTYGRKSRKLVSTDGRQN